MSNATLKKAVQFIEEKGILLVYPVDNRPQPESLWSCFWPKSEMRWEWDTGGDDRVASLWHLKTSLSESGQVVYAKWYTGRATFFSKEVFSAILAYLGTARHPRNGLGTQAIDLLEVLDGDSPQSTKQLKESADLRGKANERVYEKSMKELWSRLLIVAFGEVEDGAFPSIACGATRVMFEKLWQDSLKLTSEDAGAFLHGKLPEGSLFLKFLEKTKKQTMSAATPGKTKARKAVPAVVDFSALRTDGKRR